MDLVMPELSPGTEFCTLIRWLVADGAGVEAGQPLAELESDKASTEFLAPARGLLVKKHVADGAERVPVGTPIAVFRSELEPPAAPDHAPNHTSEHASDPSRSARPARVAASPVARRIARSVLISLNEVTGTGPRGRIVKADVLRAANARCEPGGAIELGTGTSATPIDPPLARSMSVETPHQIRRVTAMRSAIARTVTTAKREVPHFYLSVDCDVAALTALRRELAATYEKVSLNDLIVRGCALALRAVPEAHVQLAGDKLLVFERVDLAIAIAVDGGLVTPTLRGADQLDIFEIHRRTQDLAKRSRSSTLDADELSGATFTISNLGMYGVRFVLPIINAPQCGILGVGAAQERPVVRDGLLAAGTMVTLTASFDHRVVDGVAGARFLQALEELLQHPLRLLLPVREHRT